MDNQLKKHNRMVRADKDDKKEKKNGKVSPMNKKRGQPANDDDDLDSKGNIRGLIAYSDESYEDEEESPRGRKGKGGFRPKPRKAAIVAKQKINEKLSKAPAVKPKRRMAIVESEDEDDEEDEDEEDEEDDEDEEDEEDKDDEEDEEDEYNE